jgi:hypothetical protein
MLMALAVFTSAASATTDNFFGYDNLTSSNPPSGSCSGFSAGRDCAGWNYWDYSQIDRNSGSATIGMGFDYDDSQTLIYYIPIPFDAGTYTVVWNDSRLSSNPTHYNRAACLHVGGTYAYVQCRALIFP